MKHFSFSGKIWRYDGPGGWYFLYVPRKESDRIRDNTKGLNKVGWGYVKIKATVGKTSWNTTLFPGKKGEPFLLAIKADVRKKEGIDEGDMVHITCTLL